VPIEILDPFKGIEIDERRFDPRTISAAAASAAVAVGLALRRPGDK
jgi:type IV pilus assembly protein PilM